MLEKILGKGKGKNTLDPDEAERIKEEKQQEDLQVEEDILEPVDNNDIG